MKRPKSTTLSPDSARTAGLFVVSLTALVVVTCASAARVPASSGEPVGAASSRVAAAPSASAPSPATSGAVVASAVGADHLDGFRRALHDLAEGRRADPVRVLWLGDSHAAADFWPDAVRKPLQARFGVGGPGFVYVGLGVYRHAGLKVGRDGTWRVEPRQPSLWMRQDDGVFGLGGMRAVPTDAKSRVTLELAGGAVRGFAHWELSFRLPTDKATFRVEIKGGESRSVDAKTFPVGAVAHVDWQTASAGTVVIDAAAGEPELFGVIVESTQPGVVVDTLGINGARIGTPLAWESGPWLDAARSRKASLAVLAYGTNEVGDQVAPHRYAAELESLIARVREASPDAACLVMGPTDREGPDWTTLPRVVDIDAVERETAEHAGCAFFSAFRAMGGEGSLKRWADQLPPLAGKDHVHLTPRGYAELGTDVVGILGI